MSAENVEIVKGIYQAFASGDVPTVVGAMSPDIEWNEAENFPYSDGNPYRGPDAVLAGVFARIGGEWDGFSVVPERFLDAGDTVVMLGRYTGTFTATGRSMNPQVAHVWTLEGGKVVRFQQLVDTLAVARSTGSA
ncbi:MAG TPA: nuclear transport factor 2 family protein [Croceibacterium sp.]|nr:nuclear transport factor 2 family protein [Croceibacterium sp.]